MARWTMEQTLAQAPVLMLPSERLLLYALIQALRPQRCVEIGTHKGGSALIIGAALDEVGSGSLVCIDPTPLVAEEHWERVAHRAVLLTGESPGVLAEAARVVGGPFDFALVDGDHSYHGVLRDIDGVLSVLSDNAFILFHDAHFPEVAEAIDATLQVRADLVTDCGLLSVDRSIDDEGRVWGGLRLMRFSRVGLAASQSSGGDQQATDAGFRAAGNGSASSSSPSVYYLERLRSVWNEADDRAFVAHCFRILLGRETDASGSDAFTAALAAGATRLDVVNEIVRSREAAAKRLPLGWLVDLKLEFERARPTPSLLQRILRSARRAVRLPWMIEQLHALSAAQHRRLDAQNDLLNQIRSQIDVIARDTKIAPPTRRDS